MNFVINLRTEFLMDLLAFLPLNVMSMKMTSRQSGHYFQPITADRGEFKYDVHVNYFMKTTKITTFIRFNFISAYKWTWQSLNICDITYEKNLFVAAKISNAALQIQKNTLNYIYFLLTRDEWRASHCEQTLKSLWNYQKTPGKIKKNHLVCTF